MQHQLHDLRYSKQLIHYQSPAVFSFAEKFCKSTENAKEAE